MNDKDKKLYDKGIELATKGKFKKALECFNKIKNKNGDVHYSIGFAYDGLKEYKKALDCFYLAEKEAKKCMNLDLLQVIEHGRLIVIDKFVRDLFYNE